MTYLSWAAFYEGESDRAYLDLIIPRLIEDIVLTRGIRNSTIPPASSIRLSRRSVSEVAVEACKAKDAFQLIFFHADTGGRNLAQTLPSRSKSYCEAMREECDWPISRCITISPRHELEAWVLADPLAVMAALGYKGPAADLDLPANARAAERLPDPKQILKSAFQSVRGRRRPFDASQIFPAIAARQSFAVLRLASSFENFERDLTEALRDLGCV